MEGYPEGSLDHNVPFLVASGLNDAEPHLDLPGELSCQGLRVTSDLPPLDTRESQLLGNYFEEIDSRGRSWTVVPRNEPYRLRIKTVGRSYILPPRKTTLPDEPDLVESNAPLHSPFSPLSHVSPLYPDGLINSPWILKHQTLVPSIFVCFYKLSHDNRLKADVSQIRATFARSGFKTRVAIVLFGDEDSGTAELTDEVQDRLEAIRKGTALDPKSIFYIPAQESDDELKRVVDNILAILYSTAVEYYRDLGRHARKKRSRGVAPLPTIPPTSGTSHTLSLPDWNFRYDFKTAVLAEFRQELDAAIRSFEQAYEILLGQDVLDVVPSWSPRWNEARQLADIVSIRCLRLHLWMGHTSLAVRRWQTHRDRIGDFVDRRGRGTNTYGWQAWEASWATVMAHLIEKVEVPGLVPASMTIFLPPEKAVLGERLQPWELLHHTGYWYRIAAQHLAARRTLARMMPSEHRQAPDSASTTKSPAGNYDTYMCPPPYEEYPMDPEKGVVNHAQLIIDCLITSRSQFQARKQLRIAAELSLECAKEMASLGSWDEVVAILRSVWDDVSFRCDNWIDIAEDLCWLLRKAAKESGRANLVVAVDWELLNKRFPKRPHWSYNLSQSLDGMAVDTKPSIQLSDDMASPLISSSYVFRTKESKAGDYCKAQLALTSHAMPGSSPIRLSSVRVDFQTGLKPITVDHALSGAEDEASTSRKTQLTEVILEEALTKSDSGSNVASQFSGTCDLTLAAGQTRVLEMAIPLREPGEAEVLSVGMHYESEAFDLQYTRVFKETDPVTGWYVRGDDKPHALRAHAQTLRIHPRPPKLQMTLLDPSTQFYTDETIRIDVEMRNDEDEAALVKLGTQLKGEAVPSFTLQVGEDEVAGTAAEVDEEGSQTKSAAVVTMGAIASGATAKFRLTISPTSTSSTLDLLLRATYHLESDAVTTILQVLSVPLNIVGPFEANYDLVPRLHPDPWPSLFDCDGIPIPNTENDEATAIRPKGLAQQWCLLCHYASFASEDLVVVGMETQVVSCTGAAQCHVLSRPEEGAEEDGSGENNITVSPKTMYEAQFNLVAQKLSLDDRQPVTLDLAFIIKWRRQRKTSAAAAAETSPEDEVNTTLMPVGQYLVLGSEPRVLATATMDPLSATASSRLLHLDLTIENPSSHFLTFGLTMDPSDSFGFSGPKHTTVHLLPVSRRSVRFRLLPFVSGDYVRPGIVVRDKYFQKVLRIIPTEAMKIDKDGLLVWVPEPEE